MIDIGSAIRKMAFRYNPEHK